MPTSCQPSGFRPVLGGGELLVAEFHAGQLVRLVGMRPGQRHRHVEVVGAGRVRAIEDRHDETRVHRVQDVGDAMLAAQRRHRRGGGRVHLGRHETIVVEPADGRGGPAGVVVGDDEPLEEVPASGDAGRGGAHPARTDEENAHQTAAFLTETVWQESCGCGNPCQVALNLR
jgi:hypothetical protein